jgi:hypothetical protein
VELSERVNATRLALEGATEREGEMREKLREATEGRILVSGKLSEKAQEVDSLSAQVCVRYGVVWFSERSVTACGVFINLTRHVRVRRLQMHVLLFSRMPTHLCSWTPWSVTLPTPCGTEERNRRPNRWR